MCGFLAIFGEICHKIKDEDVEDCINLMRYRGPDNLSIFRNSERQYVLAHLRLAIIDKSAASNQPYHLNDNDLVFNGEIYNFREFEPASKSDTSTLASQLHREDYKFLEKIRGMYAGVMCSPDGLLVFRDYYGKKPLYYSRTKQGIIFSSEVKPLMKLRKKLGLKNTLSTNAISSYLLGGAVHDFRTLVNEVHEFPNNFYQKISYNGKIIKEDKIYNLLHLHEEKVDLEEQLSSSYKLRTITDYPLAFLFSGGLDSLALSCIAKRSSTDVTLFTLEHEHNREEVRIARSAAKRLALNHFVRPFPNVDFQYVESQLEKLDLPNGDSSYLNMMLILEEVSKEFRVCITGDGGDEIFSGYQQYRWFDRPNFNIQTAGNIARKLENLVSFQRPLSISIAYFSSLISATQFYSRFCSPRLAKALYHNYVPETQTSRDYWYSNFLQSQKTQNQTDLDSIAYSDAMTILRELLLFKADRSSMLNSVEIRSPFLDIEMAKYARSLDRRERFDTKRGKLPLRQLVERHLGNEFLTLPKTGFGIDLASLFRDPFTQNSVQARLEYLKQFGFNQAETQKLLERPKGNELKLIYALLSLSIWLSENSYLIEN